MSQQLMNRTTPQKVVRPKRRDIFLHIGKTGKLIGALIRDRRISIVRKVIFFGAILGLLILLFFPDFFDEVFLSVVMPLVGTVLGIPIDAGFDWIAFALAIVSLLRVFPAEIVGEHYQHFFRGA